MVIIYSAQDNIEASIIKGLLESNGIEASINGGYLTGAIGELPVMGLVNISVDSQQAESAKKLIIEYEQA